MINRATNYLTVDLPEHGSHVLKVVVVKEPNGGVPLVFIKWDCQGGSVHQTQGQHGILAKAPAKLVAISTVSFLHEPRSMPTTLFSFPVLLRR